MMCTSRSMFEFFGKAPQLRSAEDIERSFARMRGVGRPMIYADSSMHDDPEEENDA